MTDLQENKLSMYRASEKTLDDNNTIWNGLPAIVTTKNAFSAKIVAIQAASQQQDTIITGISTDKKLLKAALVNIATPVASAVIAFASQNNNNELLEQVNFTRTQLLETKDDMMGQRCQNIHDRANDNIAALAGYGITPAVLTTLQTAIDTYVAKVPVPRSSLSAKKAITTLLKNLFKETDVILKLQLDKVMVQFKAAEPEFFNAYTNAREIINLGSTTAKVRGTVRDQNTAPLVGVSFEIRKTATGELVGQATSSANGSFGVAGISPGDYDLKWLFSGYQTITESNVHISAGKELQRKVTMLPIKTTNYIINAGQILVLDSDVHPTPGAAATLKNTSPAAVFLHFYFAANATDPFSGTGVVLQSGEERTITLNDLGPLNNFVLAQNPSNINGSFQVTALSGEV